MSIDDSLHQKTHTEIEIRLKAIEGDIKLAKIALQVARWAVGIGIATAIIIIVERLFQ